MFFQSCQWTIKISITSLSLTSKEMVWRHYLPWWQTQKSTMNPSQVPRGFVNHNTSTVLTCSILCSLHLGTAPSHPPPYAYTCTHSMSVYGNFHTSVWPCCQDRIKQSMSGHLTLAIWIRVLKRKSAALFGRGFGDWPKMWKN